MHTGKSGFISKLWIYTRVWDVLIRFIMESISYVSNLSKLIGRVAVLTVCRSGPHLGIRPWCRVRRRAREAGAEQVDRGDDDDNDNATQRGGPVDPKDPTRG